MADKTDDLVIGVSTDLSSVGKAIRKLDGDIARAGSQIERQFATIGKSIDRAMPAAVQDRINKMVGIQTAATKEWTGVLAEQGKEMERLRARFNPMFSTINSYKTVIGEIRAAHRLGAISADEMASAIQRERQAALSSIAAIKQRNAALSDTPNMRGGAGAFNTSNLAAQGFDVVATAGFMPFYTVALQQGPQVAQVFNDIRASGQAIGPAVSAAFMQLVNPISLVTIGAIAAGAAAIQYGMDVFTATEDSAEALQKQAQLVQEVAQRWGDTYPAIKAFNEEIQRTREQADLLAAVDIVKQNELKDIPALIDQMSIEMADFVAQMRLAGEEDEQVIKLQNAMDAAAKKMRDGKDASGELGDAMSILKDGIENTANPAVQSMIDLLTTLLGVSQKTAEAVANVVNSAAKVQAQVQNAIQATTFRDDDGTVRPTSQFVPRDAPTPSGRGTPELGGFPWEDFRKKRSSGSKAPKRTADDRFFEDIEAIKQRTVALAEERAQLGLSYEAQQKRKTAFELEQKALKDAREEARKKGDQDWKNAQLTPEQVRQIDEVSSAYARQAQELRKSQEQSAFAEDSLYGLFSGIVPVIETGNKAIDNFLAKLVEVGLQAALLGKGPLGDLFGGGGLLNIGGGGFQTNTTLGNFLTKGYSTGTANTGGARGQPRGVVHGQEAVIPLPSGGQVPVRLDAPIAPTILNPTSGSGDAGNVNINVTVDGANGDQHVIDLVRQGVSEGLSQFPESRAFRTGVEMSSTKLRKMGRL